mgnify:CR=1 FL=1|jgi:protease-4
MDKNTKILLTVIGGGLVVLLVLAFAVLAYVGGSGSSHYGNEIAVIPMEGEIAYGSSTDVINPESVKNALKQANDDNGVSSILMEVNSPGGSPVASEEIMEAVNSSKKPVVVWISDIGASGAYLAVSPAKKIIASPSSMVGSIGVIMDLADLSRYYQEMGINKYAIKAGQYKDMGADYRPLTTDERNMLQQMVDEDYDHFMTLVSENRHLDKSYVSQIAEGKIYTGTEAKDLKLIDDTGSKDYALDVAAKEGGIKGGYTTITISTSPSFGDMLKNFSSNLAYSLGEGIGSKLQQGNIQYSLS